MAMADAQHMHASKMARGEEYQGKLLEARQSDWKDEFSFDNSQFARVGDCIGQSYRMILVRWQR